MEPADSDLLVSFAATGDERAFEVLVARYSGLVYGSALRQMGSPDLAKDVA
jgi:DNA-directed RNA polymerase specialized sigma24 family protein